MKCLEKRMNGKKPLICTYRLATISQTYPLCKDIILPFEKESSHPRQAFLQEHE